MPPPSIRSLLARTGVVLMGLALGCVAGGIAPGAAHYAYFERPGPHDAWSAKIGEWQSRALRAEAGEQGSGPAEVSGAGAAPAEQSGAGLLRAKFEAFRREQRRALANQTADWIQHQARSHYVPDGDVDHWATLEETLRRGADDCDGLELVTRQMLLDLGFAEDEIYRAIVVRPSDGQHHMVTFWFEDDHDPWVLDPTGAMTTGMPRMSELPEWVPIKVFGEGSEYTVRRLRAQR